MSRSGHKNTGWLLFDDTCGVCRQSVGFWAGLLREKGLETAPLQSEWVVGKLKAAGVCTGAEFSEGVRILLSDGSSYCGADACRYAMKTIWWFYPLYAVSLLPAFRGLFNSGYAAFARHRHQISRACGLDSESA